VLPSLEGLQKLTAKRKIRLYQGFDPTGYRLHLGHTVGLRKLMEFANLGHEVIFLFGTGTVLVGDPSQRQKARKLITQKEIENNIKDWKKQVKPIVDFSKVTIRENGDWLTNLMLKDIIEIASKISAIQLFKREMFQRRIEAGDTVWYHETLYPLLQAYDSVVMDVDLEIGGTDQEFNMLIGRELMRKMKGKEKYVLTTPMILGTDGKQMSKSSGNCIWLDDTPEDMFGKLMRIPDRELQSYMENLTDIPVDEITSLLKDPLAAKKRLALEVTGQFHGANTASQAQHRFEAVVQKGELPEDISQVVLKQGSLTLLDLCIQANLGVSHAQVKRTIMQGGVEWNGKRLTDPQQTLDILDGSILKFGKRQYRKVVLKH
jgi:tyrosyl-tRNA synthetase